MKIIRIIMLCMVFLCEHKIDAQGRLAMTVEQAEKLFLEKNLQLLAERCNIDIADAAIVQAKLLNNPTIGIGDFNYGNPNVDDFGLSSASLEKRLVFSAELEQIVRTAGKRKKLVDLEKVSKEIAIQEFEAFLLGLKTEVRTLLHETLYLQSYLELIKIQEESVHNLVEVFKKQTATGNIAKSELVRLQASLVELETEANEQLTALNKLYKDIKILLNIVPETDISILPSTSSTKNPAEMSLVELFEMARQSRPEFRLSDLNIAYHEKLLVYEKSQQTPDLGLNVNYDRYGGVWKDFVGIGVKVDIPAFNRNQGNIKMAKMKIEQSRYYADYQKNTILHEITENFERYTLNFNYYQRLIDNDFSEDLESMFEVYSRNLLNKNINMLEYIDFMYAYKTTKLAILTAKKNMDINFAELQCSVNNQDFNKILSD